MDHQPPRYLARAGIDGIRFGAPKRRTTLYKCGKGAFSPGEARDDFTDGRLDFARESIARGNLTAR